MKLFIAQALVEDEQLCWLDDNDPVEVTSFLGVFDDLEKAQAHLQQVANLERQDENDLIDEADTGEAHMPELTLNFTHRAKDPEVKWSRDEWTSDTVAFANRGVTVHYQVFQSRLNPVL